VPRDRGRTHCAVGTVVASVVGLAKMELLGTVGGKGVSSQKGVGGVCAVWKGATAAGEQSARAATSKSQKVEKIERASRRCDGRKRH